MSWSRLTHRLEAGEQCARACRLRAVVRTSEPLAHKPLGAGSSVLSSKDFRLQLEQRHVLIRTDNMSVVSYINHQGGVRSNKHAANLLLCADRHFLSISAAHIPSLLNHRADMLSRKGIPQGEWRLHPESVRMIWTRYGERRCICSPRARECTLPAVLLPVSLPAEGGRADIALASS